MDIKGSNVLMDITRVMFGWIVSKVFLSRMVLEFEHLLCGVVKEPHVAHFHGA